MFTLLGIFCVLYLIKTCKISAIINHLWWNKSKYTNKANMQSFLHPFIVNSTYMNGLLKKKHTIKKKHIKNMSLKTHFVKWWWDISHCSYTYIVVNSGVKRQFKRFFLFSNQQYIWNFFRSSTPTGFTNIQHI